MAEGHRNTGRFNRRTFLCAAATAAISTTGATAPASARLFGGGGYLGGLDPEPDDPAATAAEEAADTVVDLGDQGLGAGDVIDPYLDEHFQSGVEVRIPAGEYDWEGSGFESDEYSDAAIVGEGEVVLQAVDGEFNNDIVAEDGTVSVRNLTVRGTVSGSRLRLETRDDGRVVVEDWDFPDGSEVGGSSRPFYVPREHAGEIEIRDCYIRGFDDNGIYGSSSGYARGGKGGRVVVDGCVVHNCNVAGIRIGGTDSVVRNCTVVNDAKAPVGEGGSRNQRAIRIDASEHSKDILIENCDVIQSGDELGGGGPIRWSSRAGDSTGHIENVRIYNDVDTAAIAPRRERAEGWTGERISLAGDGDLDVPEWFEPVCEGLFCPRATRAALENQIREYGPY